MPDIFLTKQLLGNMRFFSVFPETDIEKFLQEANVKIHRKNSGLFLRGDKADTFFVILNGWVKLYKETPEGEDVIVSLLTKGDVFSETTLFGDKQHTCSAVTLSDASIAEISINSIRNIASGNVQVMENLLALLSRNINDLQMENEHLSVMSAPQRVGCLILKLSTSVGNKHEAVLPYDKSLAAAKLGMKPETFSRALAQLRAAGVTSRGSTVLIDNIDKLAAFCCRHCSSIVGEMKESNICLCATDCRDKLCSGNKK
jgi:CRP-like cAMP-binding protein